MKLLKLEKILLKISLIFSLIGILILTILIDNTSTIHPTQLNQTHLNKKITMNGEIIDIKHLPNITIINLKNKKTKINSTETIKIVAFSQNIKLQEKDNIKIIGTVKLYNKELEIIAEKILKVF